jgi:hypothetical protein
VCEETRDKKQTEEKMKKRKLLFDLICRTCAFSLFCLSFQGSQKMGNRFSSFLDRQACFFHVFFFFCFIERFVR